MQQNVKPILKWVGGKKQLFFEIKNRLPKSIKTYHEPFLGGGYVFFAINPNKAYLNDLNSELINVYKTIRDNHLELIDELKKCKNEPDFFYKMRALDRDENKFSKLTAVQKAARIIYLNKTCFNGLYRVNLSGQLNSPFGFYKNPLNCDLQNISNMSALLNKGNICFSSCDFDELLSKIKKDDFVYLDPPYDPISCSSSFTGYCSNGFNRNDQKRLKIFCDKINQKGGKFLMSNSDTNFIKNLYKEYNISKVYANRCINSKSDSRNKIVELLVSNYEQ